MIYIIEGARCSDTYEAMETAEVTKIHKYRAMREELRRGSTEWGAEPRAGTRRKLVWKLTKLVWKLHKLVWKLQKLV